LGLRSVLWTRSPELADQITKGNRLQSVAP